METLIAIAVLVRNPAERPTIRHPDRQRPPGSWHARGNQRRFRQYAANGGEHSKLRVAAEIAGVKPQAAGANLQTRLQVILQIHGLFAALVCWARSGPAGGLGGLAFIGFLPLVATLGLPPGSAWGACCCFS